MAVSQKQAQFSPKNQINFHSRHISQQLKAFCLKKKCSISDKKDENFKTINKTQSDNDLSGREKVKGNDKVTVNNYNDKVNPKPKLKICQPRIIHSIPFQEQSPISLLTGGLFDEQ